MKILKAGTLVSWQNNYWPTPKTKYYTLGIMVERNKVMVVCDKYPNKKARYEVGEILNWGAFSNIREVEFKHLTTQHKPAKMQAARK